MLRRKTVNIITVHLSQTGWDNDEDDDDSEGRGG